MKGLFLKTIQVNKRKLIINIVICALFSWMFVAFFPSVFKESEKLSEAYALKGKYKDERTQF